MELLYVPLMVECIKSLKKRVENQVKVIFSPHFLCPCEELMEILCMVFVVFD